MHLSRVEILIRLHFSVSTKKATAHQISLKNVGLSVVCALFLSDGGG